MMTTQKPTLLRRSRRSCYRGDCPLGSLTLNGSGNLSMMRVEGRSGSRGAYSRSTGHLRKRYGRFVVVSIILIQPHLTIPCMQDFKRLPDAQKVNFVQVPPADLRKLLPNLPVAETQPEHDDCFDLVSKLLVYPPGSRLQARDAVMHSMFTRGLPVMLPNELEPHRKSVGDPIGGRSLGERLACYMEGSAS